VAPCTVVRPELWCIVKGLPSRVFNVLPFMLALVRQI
jgi:hypothetical protein